MNLLTWLRELFCGPDRCDDEIAAMQQARMEAKRSLEAFRAQQARTREDVRRLALELGAQQMPPARKG